MARLTRDEYAQIIRREIYHAQGYDADVLATKRSNAMAYYQGLIHAPEAEDRSAFVSMDVADAVHSLMSQVMPMCQSSVLSFCPEGPEDEDQAQMETDFIADEIEKAGGPYTCYQALHDALLTGMGWIRVDMLDDQKVTEESYQNVEPAALAQLTQPQKPDQVVEVEQDGDTVTIRRITPNQQLVIKSVAPDAMLFSRAENRYSFQELHFVAERRVYTQNELRRLGISQATIDKLPDATEDYWPAIRARQGIYQHDRGYDHRDRQPAEILKECFDVHMMVDIEQNGTSELRRILFGSHAEILLEGPADFIPYALGSPIPMPHRIEGFGMYELLSQVVDAKTDITRRFIDSLELNLMGRYEAVEGSVNFDDLLDGRVAGVVRSKAPGMVNPLATPQTTGEAITALGYLDQVREQRGVASIEMSEADRQIMSASATAAAGAMANHEKMAGWYCRNLVNTLYRSLWVLVHQTLRHSMDTVKTAKIRGQWQQTRPTDWLDRRHIDIVMGLTTAERTQRITGLQQTLVQQQQWIEMGYEGIITDRNKAHHTASELIRHLELGDPSEFLVDPSTEEAQQASQQKEQSAQEQAQVMEQMQQMMMQIEQQKVQLDRYKHDTELRFKYWETNQDNEIEAAKAGVAAGTKEAEITMNAISQATNGAETPGNSTRQ